MLLTRRSEFWACNHNLNGCKPKNVLIFYHLEKGEAKKLFLEIKIAERRGSPWKIEHRENKEAFLKEATRVLVPNEE